MYHQFNISKTQPSKTYPGQHEFMLNSIPRAAADYLTISTPSNHQQYQMVTSSPKSNDHHNNSSPSFHTLHNTRGRGGSSPTVIHTKMTTSSKVISTQQLLSSSPSSPSSTTIPTPTSSGSDHDSSSSSSPGNNNEYQPPSSSSSPLTPVILNKDKYRRPCPSENYRNIAATLTLEEVSRHYHLTRQDACTALKVSWRDLKERLNVLGVARWPKTNAKKVTQLTTSTSQFEQMCSVIETGQPKSKRKQKSQETSTLVFNQSKNCYTSSLNTQTTTSQVGCHHQYHHHQHINNDNGHNVMMTEIQPRTGQQLRGKGEQCMSPNNNGSSCNKSSCTSHSSTSNDNHNLDSQQQHPSSIYTTTTNSQPMMMTSTSPKKQYSNNTFQYNNNGPIQHNSAILTQQQHQPYNTMSETTTTTYHCSHVKVRPPSSGYEVSPNTMGSNRMAAPVMNPQSLPHISSFYSEQQPSGCTSAAPTYSDSSYQYSNQRQTHFHSLPILPSISSFDLFLASGENIQSSTLKRGRVEQDDLTVNKKRIM